MSSTVKLLAAVSGITIPFLFIAGKLRQLPFFNFAQETDRCQCYMKNKATGMSSYLQVIFLGFFDPKIVHQFEDLVSRISLFRPI